MTAPMILFSGGLDSTYLLSGMLRTTDVHTLYIRGPQDTTKMLAELDARKRVFEYLERNRPFSVLSDTTVELDTRTLNHTQGEHWLIAATSDGVIDPEKHSELQIGYVIGDCMSIHTKEVTDAWNAMYRLSRATHRKQGHVNIRFPLLEMGLGKEGIVSRINEDLLQRIWVCESPDEDPEFKMTRDLHFNPVGDTTKLYPCGCCVPCRKMAMALHMTGRYTPTKNIADLDKVMIAYAPYTAPKRYEID